MGSLPLVVLGALLVVNCEFLLFMQVAPRQLPCSGRREPLAASKVFQVPMIGRRRSSLNALFNPRLARVCH